MWLSACDSTQYAFTSSISSFPLTGKSEFQKNPPLGKKLPKQQRAVAMLHNFEPKCQNCLSSVRQKILTRTRKMWTQEKPKHQR